jgi:urease
MGITRRVFLVTVHDPIASHEGNLTNALYGSFLPVPPNSTFPPLENDDEAHSSVNAPGALRLKKEDIIINKGAERVRVKVTNKGDRPVQVCVGCISIT